MFRIFKVKSGLVGSNFNTWRFDWTRSRSRKEAPAWTTESLNCRLVMETTLDRAKQNDFEETVSKMTWGIFKVDRWELNGLIDDEDGNSAKSLSLIE